MAMGTISSHQTLENGRQEYRRQGLRMLFSTYLLPLHRLKTRLVRQYDQGVAE
jgi:hypothetical protein